MTVAQDPLTTRKPAYLWGILQGAALTKLLEYDRISVIEFGVAGGAGLISMERIAEATRRLAGISNDVYGFDTGVGIPKSTGIFRIRRSVGRLERVKLRKFWWSPMPSLIR